MAFLFSCRLSVPSLLVFSLILSLHHFLAADDTLSKVISHHLALADEYGLHIPWIEEALSNLENEKKYQKNYDILSQNSPLCLSEHSAILFAFSLTIEKDDLIDFLKEDFVKELPVEIQHRLRDLKFPSQAAGTYSKISNDEEKARQEYLEVGHFLLKSTSEGSLLHILLLGPSLKTTVGKGCIFTHRFREQFIGKSQDIQNLLAIKAAGSKGFVNALSAFSAASPDILRCNGFKEIKTRVGALLGTSIEIPFSGIGVDQNSKSLREHEEAILCGVMAQFLHDPLSVDQMANTFLELPPCSWKAVTCNKHGIVGLDLTKKNLHGTLPTKLFELKFSQLRLSGNHFFGTIPSEIGKLSPSLLGLDLSLNSFTGTIPSSLMMEKLRYLTLDSNSLNGTIPSSISQLSQLYLLSLSTNHLTGPLPSSMSQMTALQQVFLHRNSLSGSIPLGLFRQFPYLHQLALHANNFVGTLPSQIGCLTSLTHLSLNSNSFTGTVPASLATINLKHLSLSSNSFRGSFPPLIIQHAIFLSHLSLHTNQFDGTLDPQIGSLTLLTHLSLHQNIFTGSVPSSILELTNLKNLSLHSNNFQSTHFSTIGNLSFYFHFKLDTDLPYCSVQDNPMPENEEIEIVQEHHQPSGFDRLKEMFVKVAFGLVICIVVFGITIPMLPEKNEKLIQTRTGNIRTRTHDPCRGVHSLLDSESDDSRILEVFDAGFLIPALKILSNSSDVSLQIASLSVIGSILSGSEDQTQAVLNCDVLSIFKKLLNDSQSFELKKQVCLAISNITAGSTKQLQEVLDSNILPLVISFGNQVTPEHQRECAFCLSNATFSASLEQMEKLIEIGILNFFVALPSRPEFSLKVLIGILNIFRLKPFMAKEFNQTTITNIAVSVHEKEGSGLIVNEILTIIEVQRR
jgi:Leucine-rich repeat (LRR) protein